MRVPGATESSAASASKPQSAPAAALRKVPDTFSPSDGNRVGEVQIKASGTQTTDDTYDLNDRLLSEVTSGPSGDTTTTYQYGGSANPGTDLTQATTVETSSGRLVER